MRAKKRYLTTYSEIKGWWMYLIQRLDTSTVCIDRWEIVSETADAFVIQRRKGPLRRILVRTISKDDKTIFSHSE